MFGICLGMQMSVVEFARNVAGLEGANSSEFGDTPYPVIDIMDSQKDITEKGGTMRLGLYPCKLTEGSRCKDIYNADLIYERHRHRWEFNNAYRKELTDKGLILAGLSPDEKLVEIVELPKSVHPGSLAYSSTQSSSQDQTELSSFSKTLSEPLLSIPNSATRSKKFDSSVISQDERKSVCPVFCHLFVDIYKNTVDI